MNFNTHFDHIDETTRRENVRLIMVRIQNITNFNVTVMLTGDFNTWVQAVHGLHSSLGRI